MYEPALSDERRNVASRSHIEGWVCHSRQGGMDAEYGSLAGTIRRDMKLSDMRHLARRPLFDGDAFAAEERRINRIGCACHIERHRVCARNQGQIVGTNPVAAPSGRDGLPTGWSTYLVGGIPVERDTITTHNAKVNADSAHHMPRSTIHNHRIRNSHLLEFPRRQTRTLQARACLVHIYVYLLAVFMRRADHTQGRPVLRTREASSIAVMNHVGFVRD